MRKKSRRGWFIALGVLLVVAAAVAWVGYDRLFRRDIPSHAGELEHFLYGSIGNDGETGVPYLIWRALPRVFPEHLPGPGGYASLGFVWEPGRSPDDTPVGFSRGRVGFERMSINCAFCHVTRVRLTPESAPEIFAGGTSNTVDVQGYQRFLMSCASDPRFTPDVLLEAIAAETDLSWLDALLYRFLIIPLTRDALLEQKAQFAWTQSRPLWGPGRIDPFNPVKFGMLGLADDGTIGNSDMQAVWGLDAREAIRADAPLHWDGLNTSIREVVVSSALGDGATASEFDWPSIDRLERFMRALPPPASPLTPDPALAGPGKAVFDAHCAECHAAGGVRTLTVIPLEEVGTDPHRAAMWTDLARDTYNRYREGYDWGFVQFWNVEGYIAEPLRAVWLLAPYLHNGSVPTIADLLKPPARRPTAFVRGLDLLDTARLGFAAPACTPGQPLDEGFCYDTTQPGNAPAGHTYGTTLSTTDKAALIAYLKTL